MVVPSFLGTVSSVIDSEHEVTLSAASNNITAALMFRMVNLKYSIIYIFKNLSPTLSEGRGRVN
jgi:hypothetical protein